MTLSQNTFHQLANALTPEVIKYILEDEKWVDFLSQIIPEALQENLGTLDIELEAELMMAIADRIVMETRTFGGN